MKTYQDVLGLLQTTTLMVFNIEFTTEYLIPDDYSHGNPIRGQTVKLVVDHVTLWRFYVPVEKSKDLLSIMYDEFGKAIDEGVLKRRLQ